MMKKRVLTGTLVAVMALSAMTTGLSFADETTATENKLNRPGIQKMQGERSGMSQEEREAQRAEREAEMQALIDEYYPEISDNWNEVKEDTQSVMEQIRELVQPEDGERPEGGRRGGEKGGFGFKADGERPDFENMTDEEIEAFKTEMFEKMKENFQNGERPEGKGEKGGKGGLGFGPEGERPDFENMTDEEIEAYKAEREAEKAEREAAREDFQTAIEEGDADTVKAHLDDMLERMEDRLEQAEAKLAELQEDAE